MYPSRIWQNAKEGVKNMNFVESFRASMIEKAKGETLGYIADKAGECQTTLTESGIRKQLEDLPLLFGKITIEEEIQEEGERLCLVVSWNSRTPLAGQNFIVIGVRKDNLVINGGHVLNSPNPDFFMEFIGEEISQSNSKIMEALITALTYPRVKGN